MAISTIYPNGVNEVIVPATQSIAISNFGGGIASIYYLIVNANRPAAYQLQQTLNNSSVVLGAFADGMTIKIEAGQSVVRYDVGASPDTGIGDADTLNGLPSDTAATADTIAARDSSGDITANAFESTVATGTAPLTVASTTLVSNLNADLLDGVQNSAMAHLAGAETFTGTKTFGATATVPLIIDSTSNVKIDCQGSTDPIIRLKQGATSVSYYTWDSANVCVRIVNLSDSSILRIKDTLDFSPDNGVTVYDIYHEGTSSASDTFTTADAKTVTVVNGLITSIV